jgi:hypothetical protein
MAKAASPKRKAPAKAGASSGKVYRVLVDMSPHETIRNASTPGLNYCCMPQPAPDAGGHRRIHGYASAAAVKALRRAGRTVRVVADAAAEGKRAKKNVSKIDRFDGGRAGPPGVGKLV